jgi:hypothetical protein
MRPSPLVALALALAAPLLAQQPPAGGGMGAMGNDPTHKVTGSGQLPAGWMLRFDPVIARPGRPTPPTPQMTDVSFTTMGSGFHARSGPAAIYYRTGDAATGQYTATATFSQARSMAHEAYGLFIGGANLQDSTEHYLYFLVRPMDGGILVSRRTSDARPTALVPWTPDPAVNKEDPSDGHATNKLAIRVGRDSVAFLANDKVVRTLAKSELGISTDGLVGLRINHNLDVHVADFHVDRRVSK